MAWGKHKKNDGQITFLTVVDCVVPFSDLSLFLFHRRFSHKFWLKCKFTQLFGTSKNEILKFKSIIYRNVSRI